MSALFLSCTTTTQPKDIVLASTTSPRDAGLLDSLLPLFEARSGYKVRVVAAGTGLALAMARRGDAEVVLVHAPELERALVDSGFFVNRRLVMHDVFILVGPVDDPAKVGGGHDAVAAILVVQGILFRSKRTKLRDVRPGDESLAPGTGQN